MSADPAPTEPPVRGVTGVVVIEREPFASALCRAIDRAFDLHLLTPSSEIADIAPQTLDDADVVYVDERVLVEGGPAADALWLLDASLVVARTAPAIDGGEEWLRRGACAVISRTATPDVMTGTIRRAAVRRPETRRTGARRPGTSDALPGKTRPVPPHPGRTSGPLTLDDFARLERRLRDELSSALHDGPLQLLLAARQEIEAAEDGDELGLGRARRYVYDAAMLLRDQLRDQDLPDPAQLGLSFALRRVAERQAERAGAVLQLELEADIAAPAAAATLVSVARELLNNAVKHADAETFFLGCRPTDDGQLELRIADDGRGFSAEAEQAAARDGHIGLTTVRRKLHELGATVNLQSALGAGTVFTILVPTR